MVNPATLLNDGWGVGPAPVVGADEGEGLAVGSDNHALVGRLDGHAEHGGVHDGEKDGLFDCVARDWFEGATGGVLRGGGGRKDLVAGNLDRVRADKGLFDGFEVLVGTVKLGRRAVGAVGLDVGRLGGKIGDIGFSSDFLGFVVESVFDVELVDDVSLTRVVAIDDAGSALVDAGNLKANYLCIAPLLHDGHVYAGNLREESCGGKEEKGL